MKRTPPIKKNDDISLKIEGMGSEGQGIGHIDGFAVFVPGALLGETVDVHIIKVMPNYAIGKVLSICEPSKDRVEPECPCANRCGGCTLQHMSYDAQLEFKRGRVRDAFRHIGGMQVDVSDIIGSEAFHRYRNKASFPFAEIDGRVELGFYAKNSHRLIPLDGCIIQDEKSVAVMREVRAWANEHKISVYDELKQKGILRHLVVRCASNGDTMAAVVTTGELPHARSLVERLSALKFVKSVIHNINRKNTNVILGDEYRHIWGSECIEERILQMRFEVSAASFLQVNHKQTERLYKKVLDLLDLKGTETVADIYCGIGTISLLIAKRAKEVVGVEEVAKAIDNAEKNAGLNGVENATFVCGRAEKVLPGLVNDGGMRFDAVVIDPPRKGCDESVLKAIADCGTNKIVYVSCNPATLVRDIKHLSEHGFGVAEATPVDMFPQTGHVETVCLLSKLKSTQHIEVELDMDELDLTDAEKKATYQKIKEYVLEHTSLKVSSLYIAQVKQKCGIIERENYNKPKSEDAKQPQCPAEKEKAIMEALKHFGMI